MFELEFKPKIDLKKNQILMHTIRNVYVNIIYDLDQ